MNCAGNIPLKKQKPTLVVEANWQYGEPNPAFQRLMMLLLTARRNEPIDIRTRGYVEDKSKQNKIKGGKQNVEIFNQV